MIARRPGAGQGRTAAAARPRRGLLRLIRRGPWENAAAVLIGLGVVMLMQPFWKWAYSEAFGVLLAGTLGFVVVSHFPDE